MPEQLKIGNSHARSIINFGMGQDVQVDTQFLKELKADLEQLPNLEENDVTFEMMKKSLVDRHRETKSQIYMMAENW